MAGFECIKPHGARPCGRAQEQKSYRHGEVSRLNVANLRHSNVQICGRRMHLFKDTLSYSSMGDITSLLVFILERRIMFNLMIFGDTSEVLKAA